jgi:tRNA pseudouridine38-40 synthase
MRIIRLLLEFDGTDFHGWQHQPGLRTVQGVLTRALEAMTRESHLLRSSSRTDAGVHASAMPVMFKTGRDIPLEGVVRGLNGALPPDLAVREALEMPEGWDPRWNSVGKTYIYRIRTAPIPSAHDARFVWNLARSLDVSAMQTGAAHLLGTHDFSAFRAAECDSVSTERDMWAVDVKAFEDEVRVRVYANAFMRNMVRIIVGTLVEVGLGRFVPDAVADILASGDRTRAGRTVPSRGLCLKEVFFE